MAAQIHTTSQFSEKKMKGGTKEGAEGGKSPAAPLVPAAGRENAGAPPSSTFAQRSGVPKCKD